MKLTWKQMIAVFTLGVLLGVSGALYGVRYKHHEAWGDAHKFHQHMMQQFTSKLKLNADQQREVSAILEETRDQMNALRQEVHPRFQAIKEASRAKIRVLLTPAQQTRFDALTAEMEARFNKRREAFTGKV